MPDPITFGAGVSEGGLSTTVAWPTLNVGYWMLGPTSPTPVFNELASEATTSRILSEEGGSATIAAVAEGLQTRFNLEGPWDVVFIDSFDTVYAPSLPCALVLEVYEEDDETIAWSVGTDPDHPNPYLVLPGNYAAQEIDFTSGAATIGQVEVVVIDKSQTVGDQDLGWMTQRLTDGGLPAIRGRRCRLRRFINDTLGYVTIIDGPAGNPRLHESFSGFRWVVKDTRENERKTRAFVTTDVWALPGGLENGWGSYQDAGGVDQWLIPPTTPLTGTYRTDTSDGKGRVTLEGYWQDAFNVGLGNSRTPSSEFVSDRAVELAAGLIDLIWVNAAVLEAGGWRWTWEDFEILWRAASSGDPWTVVNVIDTAPGVPETEPSNRSMVNYVGPNGEFGLNDAPHAEYDGIPIYGAYSILIRGYQAAGGSPVLQDGTFPNPGQSVEIALRYKGEPTQAAPLFLEFDDDGVTPLTTGRLLQKLYDGEFSDRAENGDPIPTGIRYLEEALLEMDDPVRALITGPIDDLRAVSEAEIYAPTGWAPALDSDMRIYPVSQIPPDSFDGLPEVNNSNTVPEPNWDAGEFIVNLLEFIYPRAYVEVGRASSIIGTIALRDVNFTFRSESSLDAEQPVNLETRFFVAIGSEDGTRIGTELGAQLAEDRRLYVFDRYNRGAPTIQVPVRRASSGTWKPGEWVVVDLSWLPDYLTQRRGALWGGQLMSIQDLNCAWRVMLIEEVLPLDRPDES